MRRFTTVLAAAVAMCLVVPAIAQEDPPTIYRSYSLKVKPGDEADFQAAMKKQLEWYAENNETWEWHMWQWDTGDRFGEYLFRSPGHRWEDMDERSERGARASAHYREVVSPHVESLGSSIGSVLLDVSRWPDDLGRVPLVSVYTFQLNYGMDEAFNNTIAKIHEAIGESEWPLSYAWATTVSGGEAGTYALVIPRRSWADMKGPEKPFWAMMEETIGRRKADAIRADLQKCVREQSSALARFLPDLSYFPEE